MNDIIKIAICESDTLAMEAIISSVINANYLPEYVVFASPSQFKCDPGHHDFDFLIIDLDEIAVNYTFLKEFKIACPQIDIVLIHSDLDEVDSAGYILHGADIFINKSNMSRIGNILDKYILIKAKRRKTNFFESIDIEKKSNRQYWDAENDSPTTHLLQQEIVELLKSEEKLRQNQHFYNTILENIPNVICVKDIKTMRYTYINKAFEKIIGYTPKEIIGRNAYDLFSKDYADFYTAKDMQLLENKKQIDVCEEMVLTKDNKLKIFFTKKLLIGDKEGNPNILLGISEDLTESYKAQEELRKSEMRFSKIFNSSPVAIFVLSAQTKHFIDVNSKFLDILGYTREEVIGKNIKDFDDVFDEMAFEMVSSALTEYSGFINKEIDVKSRTEAVSTLLVSLEHMEFSSESWGIFMGLDITERKLADIEIQAALEKQKELNLLKTQFISMISHEFRTPLTTIMLSTDLLNRYSDRWQKEERDKHFIRIKDTILKMTQLMENVLIIGRIDSGKFMFNPEEIDLQDFCKQIAKSIEFSSGSTHKINISFVNNCGSRMFDENLLGLIINNLLSNAVKYSPSAKEVEFKVLCNANNTQFIFKDNGIGIPSEQLNHLFQSFFRGNNVGPIAGYGLGLSIVKKCIDTHNGEIVVESQPGLGTTMIVTLPVS